MLSHKDRMLLTEATGYTEIEGSAGKQPLAPISSPLLFSFSPKL